MDSEVSEKEEHNQEEPLQNQNLPQKEDNLQILVKNIPETTKEEKLREIFEKFGKIIEIKLNQDNGSNQMAYIKFQTKEEKDSALNSNEDLEIDGNKLEIQDSLNEENTLFVGNIPYSSTEEDLEKFFADCGKVKVHIHSIDGKSKGYAYVTFQDNNSVEMALKKDGEKIMERSLKIDIIRSRSALLQNGGRRRSYRGRGRGRGSGRGGSSYGYYDRERNNEYFRDRRNRDRDRDRDRDRERSDRDRHGDREWENGRSNYRIRDRERERDREWNRRERSRDYYRIRDRDRERDRVDRDRERERERERDRIDEDRERIEKERERGERERNDRERERERERDMERDRERYRERDRNDRERERRHSNYERDYRERE